MENCHIHRFNRWDRSYKGAVNIDGVGNFKNFTYRNNYMLEQIPDDFVDPDKGGFRLKPDAQTYHEAVNPLVEIVSIRKVCENLLALPEGLTTQEWREQWRRLIGELPPIPTRTVNGKTLLAPAEQYRDKKNSENPELHAPQRTVIEGRYRGGRLESWKVTPEERKRDVQHGIL